MTTKTTKKQAESAPEAVPNGTPASDQPDSTRRGLLTDEERRALLESLPAEKQELFGLLTGALLHQQQREEAAAFRAALLEERRQQVAAARELARGDSLDAVEQMSLHLIGKLAMGHYITRGMIEDGGLEGLFMTINEGVREALVEVDTSELETIAEGEAAEIEIAADARSMVDDDGKLRRDRIDDDDYANGDELPKSAQE